MQKTANWNAKCGKPGSSAKLLDGHMAFLNVTHYFIYEYTLL